MHIEKNVCESVVGTVLNLEGKTKDIPKARIDLKAMGLRKHLWLRDGKRKMPQAPYTVKPKHKHEIFRWLSNVRYIFLWLRRNLALNFYQIMVICEKYNCCLWIYIYIYICRYPYGYAGNISRCVNYRDNKMYGLKSPCTASTPFPYFHSRVPAQGGGGAVGGLVKILSEVMHQGS